MPTTVPAAPREPGADVDRMFVERWSPRAYRPDPVHEEDLRSVLEAARWAPSSYNEQPWVFLVARSDADRDRFLGLLNEKNQSWARHAPVLLFLVARRHHARTGKENRMAQFDCGAAWMALALQALKRGLHCRAMEGFDRERAYDVLGVPRDDAIITCAIALGYRGDGSELLPEHQDKERQRSPRMPQDAFVFEGGWG